MSTVRVDQISPQQAPQQPEPIQQQQQQAPERIELHTQSSFERGSTLPSQAQDILPGVDAEQLQRLDGLFGAMSPEQRANLSREGSKLTELILTEAQRNPPALEGGPLSSGLAGQLATTASSLTQGQQDVEASDAMTGIMFTALEGYNDDLRGLSTTLKENLGYAEELRTQMTELRDMVSDWPEGETQEYSWIEVTRDSAGNLHVEEHTKELTQKDAEELMNKLDSQKTSLTDLTDLQRHDLQHLYQKKQQATQLISNLMKSMHDTLSSIIRNMR